MKKIGIVNLRFYPATGGVETVILQTCKRLVEKFDIEVVTSNVKTEKPYQLLKDNELVDVYQQIPILRLASKKILPIEGYGILVKNLEYYLKNFSLIHAHGYGYYHTDKCARVAKKYRIPSVVTLHLHPAPYTHHKILRTLYDSTAGKRTLRLYDRVISLTNVEKEYVMRRFGINSEKIRVIPNGVELDKFKDLKIPKEENTLLFVGRLSQVKSLDVLVKTLSIIKRDIPKIKLKLVGEDWGVKWNLIKLAKELDVTNNIEFLGKLSEDRLIELYNEAKLFVTSTKYESFGITILEAIACGTPVVASNVGGIPEVIGNCGLLCERSPEDFAQNILKILKDSALYSECKENTRTWREKFSWDVIAEKISNIYSEMLR